MLSNKPPTCLHLFLLAGQSNMAGRGTVEPADMVVHPRVWNLDRERNWVPAVDPIHFDKPEAGVSLGRTFGLLYSERNPDADVGLIPCAVGGSHIETWAPNTRFEPLDVHPYDDAIARARIALRSGELKGILWHQGESDCTPERAPHYQFRLRTVLHRFRAELQAENAPVLIGQMGRFPGRPWTAAHEQVDQAQRSVADELPKAAFVSSEGLTDRGDHLHFDAASLREFGRRYFAAYMRFR